LWKHDRPLVANSDGFRQQDKQNCPICIVHFVLSQLFNPEMVPRADAVA
jgi:hypothetical protein